MSALRLPPRPTTRRAGRRAPCECADHGRRPPSLLGFLDGIPRQLPPATRTAVAFHETRKEIGRVTFIGGLTGSSNSSTSSRRRASRVALTTARQDIYLYCTTFYTAQAASASQYLRSLNQIHDRPRCITPSPQPRPPSATSTLCGTNAWDWRILLMAKATTHVRAPYDRHRRLPFAELKQRAHQPAAQAANDAPDSPAASAKIDRALEELNNSTP
jgi:hypothetical protein